MEDKIKIECTVNNIRFYKDGYGIISVTVDKIKEGTLVTDQYNTILKGEMPKVKEGESYCVNAKYDKDPTWGDQYKIELIASSIVVSDTDINSQRKFLESIFTHGQVQNMYEILDNPFIALKDAAYSELVKVKGCSLKTAPGWCLKFQQNYFRSRIYAELQDYNLSAAIIDRLIERYKSPDIIIEKIKDNPYILVTEVHGIGWAIADKIAVAGGMNEFDPRRISAFIMYYLEEKGENGFSWIELDELWGACIEKFGENIPDENIATSIRELGEEELWWNDDKTLIGLKKYYYIESKIAEEIMRLLKSPSRIKYSDWEDAVKRIERLQGWEYTDEQKIGIKAALDNNLIIIQGSAGSGKSSLVAAILEVLKGYAYAQCALSGKAASRLMEVTGQEGQTIHRLLGYPAGPANKGGFAFHDEKQLGFDIYIIDEVSMINLELFYALLKAIPDGSKVICLGDNGQLEAIGSGNLAYDMLTSEDVPSITLNKIHRQAEDSAIVTESVKIRNKTQIVPKDWVGQEVRGKLQDLNITCYSDISNTYYEIMKRFSTVYSENKNIMDIQVIVPTKFKGAGTYLLNNAIQEICNPGSKNKEEVVQTIDRTHPYVLRVGDKVICTKNNYKVFPNIYNGNTGFLKGFDIEEDYNEMGDVSTVKVMIVDFVGIGIVKIPIKYWNSIELAYALTCHKCVVADTYIYTNQGLKQIIDLDNGAEVGELKEINPSDAVSVLNGNGMEQPSHFYNAGYSNAKILTTKRGYTLTATYDHGVTVLTEEGNFVRKNVNELTKDDYLTIRVGANVYGDKIDLPDNWFDIETDVRTVIYNLPRQLTPEFAQFLGHMVADGVITHSGFRVGKNQQEVVEEVARLANSIFGCKTKVQKILDGPNGGMWIAEVSSKHIRAFLQKIDGLQPNNKYVPNCILEAPEIIQTSFLKGLFEDGSVNIKKNKFDHIELALRGDKIMNQVRYMLLNLGIISSYSVYLARRYDKLKVVPVIHIYIYKDEARIFRDKIGFVSYNKKERLDLCLIDEKHSCPRLIRKGLNNLVVELIEKSGISTKSREMNRTYNNLRRKGAGLTQDTLTKVLAEIPEEYKTDELYIKLEDINSGKYFFDPIVDIKDTVVQTYCLTMPQTHQFVQNGIMGWNCQGSESDIVIFGLDFSAYSLLSKELVYTGITRAKKMCYLIAQTNALRYATGNSSVVQKQTHLKKCLHDLFHPTVIF